MQSIWITALMIVSMTLQPFTGTPERAVSDHSFASSTLTEKAIPAFVYLDPLELKVILKTYEGSELIDTKIQTETIWAMEDFWAAYEGWTVEDQSIGEVVFQKQLEIA
ncbi:BofC N-terminal domain-containing protein [Halobacillus campisalis]|uniref:BofC N-terminal domain-containing protein n=1 Tax=Halobacillus campisalis TaxID=435909 RepID=A0ABW2K2T6_9BACI|nr:BofC N-terminal domain-containing protein [Halobacillus campisalis]